MFTIGLIDNFVITRLGLSIFLQDHFKDLRLLEAGTVQEFGTLHKQQNTDLIIMGNNFIHDEKCLAAARQLKKQNPDIPLITYDEHLRENLTVSYFRIGISGYLLRQNTVVEMLNCIKAVLNNKHYLCPALTEQLLISLCKSQVENQTTSRTILTRRESEIANYLGQGMRTSHISLMLGRKSSTISSIKRNIFKKLNVKNILELMDIYPEYHS